MQTGPNLSYADARTLWAAAARLAMAAEDADHHRHTSRLHGPSTRGLNIRATAERVQQIAHKIALSVPPV